jgi:soluble lytic murein transglycosylase
LIITGKRKRKRRIVFFLILVFIALYQIHSIEKVLYPYPYKQIVEKYAAAYGVDPLLVISVIREESHFIPLSSSHKGAVGLMQLMPETAEEISVWLKEDYAQIDLEKPEDNIRYGTWYLSTLQKQFSGNSILVLAAYNAGSGRVTSWLETSVRDLNTYQIEEIPFKETREYVVKVLRSYGKYAELYGK